VPRLSIGPISIFIGSRSTPFGTPFAIEWCFAPNNLIDRDKRQEGNVGKVNWLRVALGGLLAGLIIDITEGVTNGAVLGSAWKTWAEKVGPVTHQPSRAEATALWTFLAFALGLISVWMYAAVRPRFGTGPRTAIIVAVVMWVTYWPLVAVQQLALGTVPTGLLVIGSIGGLVGMVVALLAGSAVYKEQN
jgi:hypothetical protein